MSISSFNHNRLSRRKSFFSSTHYEANTIFEAIENREPVSKTIASLVEDAIKLSKFKPGDKLPSEPELCNQFRVSRTAVREALKMLAARGLITIKKGKGMYVSDFSSQNVVEPLKLYLQFQGTDLHSVDVIESRMMIEPAIAYYAAQNRNEEDIEMLKKDYDDLKTCDNDPSVVAHFDSKFHLDIARSSHNPILPLILAPIHQLMPIIKSHILATVGEARESAIIWHKKILDAIIDGDTEKAYSQMKKHLEIAIEHTKTMISIEKQAN